jgi:predicted mannosyl-3-phosphoglycerate phosphatase (HAD superfamily)
MEIRVMPADVVESGSCIKGARQWFTLNGLGNEFGTFIKDGVALEKIQALNCPIANRACEVAIKRAQGADQ